LILRFWVFFVPFEVHMKYFKEKTAYPFLVCAVPS